MFNPFKKKDTIPQALAKSYTVNVKKEGVFVNDTLVSPMTLSSLSAVLGKPRILLPDEKTESKNYKIIWDAAGVRAYTKDKDKGGITVIDIMLYDDPERNLGYDKKVHHSQCAFSGTVLIDDKPFIQAFSAKELKKVYIFAEAKKGSWVINFRLTEATEKQIESDRQNIFSIIRSADIPFSWAYISYKPPRISTGKYLHKKPEEAPLSFKNFNFKLAIVEELMYKQHLIEPAFGVYDFANDYAKRKIDVDSEGYEIIPEVKKWFKELPVDSSLAEKIETLYLDGGNDIYTQIFPFWDGEDTVFDIKAITSEELGQFPKLKRIETTGIGLSPQVRKLLIANGIEVEIG